MKNCFFILIIVLAITACAGPISSSGGELTGVRGRTWSEPAPYGMVLVKRGSIDMGSTNKDSLWGNQQDANGVSVDAFWMDEKEVSNVKYRQFVHWVPDFIIRA